MIKVAPSLLAANPLLLGQEAQRMVDAGCDWLHVDVMDGHFVPNLTFGPHLVKALRQQFSLPLDVHLMVSNPEDCVESFIRAGADYVTVHAEAARDLPKLLTRIRQLGAHAGVSLKPGTSAQVLRDVLPLCDMILIMTVEPGFGGQAFQPEQTRKLRELRALGYRGLLEADGGVSLETLPQLIPAGLDVAVLGTALYHAKDPQADIQRIHGMESGAC